MMISYCGKLQGQIQHFRGITSDIQSDKHLPVNGRIPGTEVKLRNGDELYCFQGSLKGKVWIYDAENVSWEKQGV